MNSKWTCPKCSNSAYETDQFAATGGGFSKFLDVQNKKITTVSCTQCGFTEFYKTETSTLGNVFDFFMSNN